MSSLMHILGAVTSILCFSGVIIILNVIFPQEK